MPRLMRPSWGHKLDQLFDLLVDHVLNLAELGVTPALLADPMELQKFKDTTLASASRLSVQRLGALVAAFRRWQRYCAAHGHDVRAPTPLHLAEFLREISSGGPTAGGWYACLPPLVCIQLWGGLPNRPLDAQTLQVPCSPPHRHPGPGA